MRTVFDFNYYGKMRTYTYTEISLSNPKFNKQTFRISHFRFEKEKEISKKLDLRFIKDDFAFTTKKRETRTLSERKRHWR